MKFWNAVRAILSRITRIRFLLWAVSALTAGISALANVGYCQDDMTSVVTQWLPTILTFAMLGMVMGLLKKFGKF